MLANLKQSCGNSIERAEVADTTPLQSDVPCIGIRRVGRIRDRTTTSGIEGETIDNLAALDVVKEFPDDSIRVRVVDELLTMF